MTTPDQSAPEPSPEPASEASPEPSPVVSPGYYSGTPFFSEGPVAAAAAPIELPQEELVSRGLAFSLGAIPVGMFLAVVIWKLGFVGAISSFVIAGGAVFLYSKGALTPPKRGLVPLVGVIIVGVAASFLAIVASDLLDYYKTPSGQALGYPSSYEFVKTNLFNMDVITSYGSDLAMFGVFALLGIFGTLRRLMTSAKGAPA
ncbi:hypothetical protein [Angustibacter luteus]|uniref:DUF4199 family protein n=1 Tax=Angustibacter luteus TaxID=658456 RepID=A0ABW1JD77_9ACTN